MLPIQLNDISTSRFRHWHDCLNVKLLHTTQRSQRMLNILLIQIAQGRY